MAIVKTNMNGEDIPLSGSGGTSLVGIATTEKAGIVKPDGETLTIETDGTMRASKVKVDGTTITIDEALGIISLAKELADKIDSIDDMLLAENVVDNQTTIESGKALDARQANPNVEGSLAKQLADMINSFTLKDLTSKVTFNADMIKTNYGSKFYKIGKMVFVIVNLTVNSYSSSSIALGTLPEELIPAVGPVINTTTNNAVGAYFYIRGNQYSENVGEFGITKSSTWSSGDGIRVSFAYCIP